MKHFVYILKCVDKTLYVGCTNNLEKRLKEHNNSKGGAHYTKIRRPVILKYSEQFPTLAQARTREAAFKRLSHDKKLTLIKMKKQNPHDFRINLTEEELELFGEFKVKNILEVFCGDGRNLIALRELGYDTTGIEEQSIFEKALPFENESFDAVYSWQYINHNLKNKIENVFKEIYRVLKINGIFSIKISDFEQLNFKQIGESLYEEQDLEFGKMQYKMIAPQTFVKLSGDEKDIPHYAFYQNELIESLEKIGFQQINSRKIKWNIVANFKKIDKKCRT